MTPNRPTPENSSQRHTGRDRHGGDMNRDPISGAPGSHPVGTGVGGAAGGIAGGALAGSMFGPIGTLVGAGVGVVAGAAAGKGVAERIDPTAETEYWREQHRERPYARDEYDFDRDYAAAYGYGLQAREQLGDDRDWKQVEPELRDGWDKARGQSRMDWDEARQPAGDAYVRADRTLNTYRESDRHFQSRFDQAEYPREGESFEDYRPAYRYGVLARTRHGNRDWNSSLDKELERDWDIHRGASNLPWGQAKIGVQEAYNSPYIDDSYNSPYDQKPDYNANEEPAKGMFRVR